MGEGREIRQDPARLSGVESGGLHRTVRITRATEHLELYFPPLRMPEVAIPLALFGIIAMALPGLAIFALLPSLTGATGMISAVLVAAFVLPFGIFGGAFVLLAIYMLANALVVRFSAEGVDIVRLVLGASVRHRRVALHDMNAPQPEITSRYQSLFSSEPVYQLVSREKRTGKRTVLAETLIGEASMLEVKALIERAMDATHTEVHA